jgi:D-alanyl-D-alanine carboxypeptidase
MIDALQVAFPESKFSTAVLQQGTLDLSAQHNATTELLNTPNGDGYPFSTVAADPNGIASTMGGNIARALSAGEVVVSQTSATTNHIILGDTLTLNGWSAAPINIAVGLIAPDTETGGAELVISNTSATAVGLNRPFYFRVSNLPDRDAATKLAAALQDSWTLATIRIKSSWAAATIDDTIAQGKLKQLLGSFWVRRGSTGTLRIDPAWKLAHTADVNLPIVGTVRCNTVVAKAAGQALQELVDQGLSNLINGRDSRRNGGCFSARVTRSVTGNSGHNLSRHTWGAAIDLNPSRNPYGGPSTMDQRVIDAFHHHGFMWGGTFIVPDPMHFEYTGTRSA